MVALIFGCSSFVGRHLVRELLARGVRVAGTCFRAPEAPAEPVYRVDVLDRRAVDDVVRQVRPQVVYHLAAEAVPARCWENPARGYAVNLEGTAHVAAACASLLHPPLLVLPSSAHVYGKDVPETRGLRETDACHPLSPYGIAKLAAELHLGAVAHQSGLPFVIFRLFNQFGPGQRGSFFIPEMAESIARIRDQAERDRTGPSPGGVLRHPGVLRTGDLSLRRDFLDVRDAVKALAAATCPEHHTAIQGKTYNLGRGVPSRLADLVQVLIACAGTPVAVETDSARIRPGDPPALWADISRLRADTGWKPERPLEASLKEVLEEFRVHAHDDSPAP